MKRRNFIKTGLMTAGGVLIPSESYGSDIGKIIDSLSEEPVEGAIVDINGEKYVSDSNGICKNVVGVEPSIWRDIKLLYNDDAKYKNIERRVGKKASDLEVASISHDDYYNAVRNVDPDNFNIDIIPKSFDMELFDMWCRSISGATQRWKEQPSWYIDTRLANKDQIDLVYEIINNDLVEFSNGFINNPEIKDGEEPPEYGELGKIVIIWKDEGGPGAHAEWINNNEIYAGAVRFNLIKPTIWTYLQELTQVLGARTETETRYFFDENGYLESGLQIGKILYSRAIGSKSPDTDPRI